MSSFDRILPFLAPIAHLLSDQSITEVMVNAGGSRIFIEQRGEVRQVDGCELTEARLRVAIKNIARTCGDDISEARPILDARLEDGSRIAAMFPPCAVDGTMLTIRRFGRRYSLPEFVESGALQREQAAQLMEWIEQRRTLLISGGTGTGKTTLLNALAEHIPSGDRVALLEDTSEIAISVANLIRFETRKENRESAVPVPAVTMADLLRAALRHRPDRIILGEVRGMEAFDLLQALNTGHQGSMTTIHANSAPAALTRLAHCVLSAGMDLPNDSVREAIAEAVQFVVHVERRGGVRTDTQMIAVEEYHRPTGQWRYSHVGAGASA